MIHSHVCYNPCHTYEKSSYVLHGLFLCHDSSYVTLLNHIYDIIQSYVYVLRPAGIFIFNKLAYSFSCMFGLKWSRYLCECVCVCVCVRECICEYDCVLVVSFLQQTSSCTHTRTETHTRKRNDLVTIYILKSPVHLKRSLLKIQRVRVCVFVCVRACVRVCVCVCVCVR